jgi:hypothetical protein
MKLIKRHYSLTLFNMVRILLRRIMPQLPNNCPGCSGPLEVTRLTCHDCAMQIEGRFALPDLLRLNREDQEFILAFVRASGSLKQMGAKLGLSYPTVRNRLDELIARLDARPDTSAAARREILDAVARGELSVKEAAKRLEELS